jgi:hypothetical protein
MLKKITLGALVAFTATTLLAQQTGYTSRLPAGSRFSFFTDGGITLPPGSLRNNGYTGRGYGTTAGLYLPFYQKHCGCLWKSSKTRSYSFGFIAGGGYMLSDNGTPELEQTRQAYRLDSGALNLLATPRPVTRAWQVFGGLQANFGFSRFTISPSVSAGYMSITNSGFTTCAIRPPGFGNLTLRTLPATNTTGMVVNGRLELRLRITKTISLYAASVASYGPEIKNVVTALSPAGGFRANNTYTLQQLLSGKDTALTSQTRFATLSLNGGLRFDFGGRRKKTSGQNNNAGGPAGIMRNPTYCLCMVKRYRDENCGGLGGFKWCGETIWLHCLGTKEDSAISLAVKCGTERTDMISNHSPKLNLNLAFKTIDELKVFGARLAMDVNRRFALDSSKGSLFIRLAPFEKEQPGIFIFPVNTSNPNNFLVNDGYTCKATNCACQGDCYCVTSNTNPQNGSCIKGRKISIGLGTKWEVHYN